MAVAKKKVAKKAVVKKAVTKRVTKKTAPDTAQNAYVISERKLFTWKPIYYSTNHDEAVTLRRSLETTSIYGPSGYKLDTVRPIKTVSL